MFELSLKRTQKQKCNPKKKNPLIVVQRDHVKIQ